jgi:hypothetical protein
MKSITLRKQLYLSSYWLYQESEQRLSLFESVGIV